MVCKTASLIVLPRHRHLPPHPTPPHLPETGAARGATAAWWMVGVRRQGRARRITDASAGSRFPLPPALCFLPPAPCPLPCHSDGSPSDLSLLQSGDGSSCRRMCGRAWPSCMSRAAARAPGAGCSSRWSSRPRRQALLRQRGGVEADCQSDCSRRSSARCQRRATVLLATLGWQVCRQLTGFRGSEGPARVLVGGHAKGDGHATPAGWVAIVGRTTMRGGRNEGGRRR